MFHVSFQSRSLIVDFILLLRRGDREPCENSQVCSCHFKNADFQNLPTLFERNNFGEFDAVKSPEKLKRRPRKRARITQPNMCITEVIETEASSTSPVPLSNVQVLPTVTLVPSLESHAASHDIIYDEIIANCEIEIVSELEELSLPALDNITEVEIVSALESPPLDLDNATEVEIVPTILKLDAATETESEFPPAVYEAKINQLNVEIEALKNENDQIKKKPYEFPPVVYEAQIDQLNVEIKALKIENELIKKQPFGFFSLKGDCSYYTGIALDVFLLLEEVCAPVCAELPLYDGRKIGVLQFRDQFLLVFMKLRLNLDYIDLAKRFGISRTSAYRIFRNILPALHVTVFQAFMDEIPSRRKIQQSVPSCFDGFPNCRMVLDSTEMRCQSPSHLAEQKMTYSSYKHYTSAKATIAILPNGSAIACTACYPGSTSDKAIVEHSNILKNLLPGDLVLADKGFTIYSLLPKGVSLNIPPFLTCKQFTPSEIMETRSIAKARIHIERFNIRLKNYRIVRLIPYSSFKFVSMIVQTCVSLVNFQNSLLKEISEMYFVKN